jgi:hypothetical protein
MDKYLALALLVTGICCLSGNPALAELTIIEETDAATIYRDGAQIVVLVEGRYGDVFNFAMRRSLEKLRYPKRMANKEARSAGVKMYQTRIRPIGDDLVCEKFALRPDSPEKYLIVAKALIEAPC